MLEDAAAAVGDLVNKPGMAHEYVVQPWLIDALTGPPINGEHTEFVVKRPLIAAGRMCSGSSRPVRTGRQQYAQIEAGIGQFSQRDDDRQSATPRP